MEFKDRVPTKPNRKKIVFEDDNTTRYATVEYADEPTEQGTPLNKSTFLEMTNNVVAGTYIGAGEYEDTEGKTVNLGFRPSFVLLNNPQPSSAGGNLNQPHFYLAIADDEKTQDSVIINDTGFVAKGAIYSPNPPELNINGRLYTYIAGKPNI